MFTAYCLSVRFHIPHNRNFHLYCSLMSPKPLKQCPAHSKSSVNICWVSEWMNEIFACAILSALFRTVHLTFTRNLSRYSNHPHVQLRKPMCILSSVTCPRSIAWHYWQGEWVELKPSHTLIHWTSDNACVSFLDLIPIPGSHGSWCMPLP